MNHTASVICFSLALCTFNAAALEDATSADATSFFKNRSDNAQDTQTPQNKKTTSEKSSGNIADKTVFKDPTGRISGANETGNFSNLPYKDPTGNIAGGAKSVPGGAVFKDPTGRISGANERTTIRGKTPLRR